MSTGRRIAWWVAILSFVVALGPVAIAITLGNISATLGMMGYLSIVTLPVAIIGIVLVPILLALSAIDWLRGRR